MSVTCFSGWGCLALLYVPMGIALGPFYSGRGVAIGPNVLWSTPFPAQKSTIEVTSREYPCMLMWVMLGRHIMLQVECVLHCTFLENGIQTKHGMQTDTQANPCIPDTDQSSICQQTKILVSPWELVLGGSGAASKWGRLVQTTLGYATCCAWYSQLLSWVYPFCPALS